MTAPVAPAGSGDLLQPASKAKQSAPRAGRSQSGASSRAERYFGIAEPLTLLVDAQTQPPRVDGAAKIEKNRAGFNAEKNFEERS